MKQLLLLMNCMVLLFSASCGQSLPKDLQEEIITYYAIRRTNCELDLVQLNFLGYYSGRPVIFICLDGEEFTKPYAYSDYNFYSIPDAVYNGILTEEDSTEIFKNLN